MNLIENPWLLWINSVPLTSMPERFVSLLQLPHLSRSCKQNICLPSTRNHCSRRFLFCGEHNYGVNLLTGVCVPRNIPLWARRSRWIGRQRWWCKRPCSRRSHSRPGLVRAIQCTSRSTNKWKTHFHFAKNCILAGSAPMPYFIEKAQNSKKKRNSRDAELTQSSESHVGPHNELGNLSA